ncbi:hypothetical protein A3A71_01600 [Candidatus Berkelbacteria bacterium RIFCSPLOWO2_01_FULL_50_28]|uniref:Uncharacterized protein n=1 Tax=Candidatus Berkelbacteria bacterium RIFCSPLOWO2_01_FULL_50_28 TaxID=1797471 RepID=A0A1F5EBE1_9BACT|nr:MAG: hypothetical protein A3F39_03045 [Candidatus Berkelbacteria bacterium RIFCSPHIGHO2_12_FULL_50_11]OGD64729.1 MAG: hypothetical protein A3A71_01600 [Candidatus Berkelbacteria bacterium RIFCSPLOWO2_01_FULL_50_28]
MPELPEVETIKRSLNQHVLGQTIQAIEIRLPKLFRGNHKDVVGSKIDEIARRAKMLIWKLSNGKYLLFHLKMTGQMLYVEQQSAVSHQQSAKLKAESRELGADEVIAGGGHPDSAYLKQPPHEFTHVIFTLDKGHLYFNDLRQFGWIKVLDEASLKEEVAKLGPEIDWPEFNFDYFALAMEKKARTKIKTVLMFQDLIAGIGNIYSDEILFVASILPTRPAGSLNKLELKRIYNSIPKVIALALKHGGTSLKDYRRLDGSQGNYLHFANVYHRTGLPCRTCGKAIERTVVNGRSAHFCPNCQK